MRAIESVLAVVCVGLAALLTTASSASAQNAVCDKNAYALCSHASCACLDANGKEGKCEIYDGDRKGWAKCTCPVVLPSDAPAYNANFGTRKCAERATPSATAVFPPFLDNDKIADVYSEYSLGDGLAGPEFDTLADAELLVCDRPEMFTLCLDMPCEFDPASGKAICYCRNVSSLGLERGRKKAQAWNTFGGGCDVAKCDPGDGHVWSAALVSDTWLATDELQRHIRRHGDPTFRDRAEQCTMAGRSRRR